MLKIPIRQCGYNYGPMKLLNLSTKSTPFLNKLFIHKAASHFVCRQNWKKIYFSDNFTITRPSCSKYYSTMTVKERVDTVLKSKEDSRLYRALILQNDMKVLLISDSTTDKSAAALDIHIGSMSDPTELPGLAHFCEHMLFMGTEKYPCENDYNKYLSEHSGSSNAYTGSDHTNFYFDVAPDAFSSALDRFAQFFLSPLFTESGVDREVNAVNSEHDKNIQNDYWRLLQLDRHTSNPLHDFSKFGTGNKQTLDIIPKEKGISVRDALLDFHKLWYSSNIMALTILGKESLDELEEMAVSLFSLVENKDVILPSWMEHPFTEAEHKKVISVVPVKDIRTLNMSFPIPDLHPHYKTSPGHYLGHLIGHEGPGSLLSYLKALGWVNSLVAGQKAGAKGFAFFVVNVDLTTEGIFHTNDIVKAVFQYLNLLKKEGIQEWIFNECKDLGSMTFRFKDKERPQSYACNLAEQLHYYPLEEVLGGGYLLSDYKADVINSVLEKLVPDTIRIIVMDQSFDKKADLEEPWYGTKYSIENIDEELLKSWSDVGYEEQMHLPPRNEFVPTNFELHTAEFVPPTPELLRETPLDRLWYKLDNEFKLPKNIFYAELFSAIAYLDPHHTNLLQMFVQLFRDALTEYTYAAELAGLYYHLSNTKYGLTLNIQGYNDKQDVLLEKIMDRLTSFRVDPKRFEILKEKYVRGLRNFAADQPHQHVVYYTTLLLSEHGWDKDELLNKCPDLTVKALEAFIPHFLSSLHLEFLIHGNVSQDKALKLAEIVIDPLIQHMHSKPLLPTQLLRQREYQIPSNSSWIYQKQNHVHRSSSVETFYQCGLQNTNENMLLELIGQIFSEPAYDELRTKEQLGYIVWSGLRRTHGTQGFRVIVQGNYTPCYLDSRIESFLHKMGEHLQEMTDSEFCRHRDALAKRRLEKPKKLSHLSTKWWQEITCNQYQFDRDDREVAHLKTITKENVIDFYNQLLSSNGKERKKLSVQVISTVEVSDATDKQPTDGLKSPPPLIEPQAINDIAEFKQGLALYPLMKPFISISKSKL